MSGNAPLKSGITGWLTETVRIATPRWVLLLAGLAVLVLVFD